MISTVALGLKVSVMEPAFVSMQMALYIKAGGLRVNGAVEALSNLECTKLCQGISFSVSSLKKEDT